MHTHVHTHTYTHAHTHTHNTHLRPVVWWCAPRPLRRASGGIKPHCPVPLPRDIRVSPSCSLRLVGPLLIAGGSVGMHWIACRYHGPETPKLPLSATAPAGEHGGTAHVSARRVPHDHEHRATHTVVWVLHPAAVGGSRGRSQLGMHLEHTPGYGDTPPCRASEAAEGPPRRQPAGVCPGSLRGWAPALIAPGYASHLSASCVLFKDGGPAHSQRGEEGGFRFNDSTGAGRPSPGGRLKIESTTSRDGGSGICVPARRVRGSSCRRLGTGPRAFPWPAGKYKARPAIKRRLVGEVAARSAHCGAPIPQQRNPPLRMMCAGLSGNCTR